MAKVIMVQGTSSGVGKSVLTTALCRIFTEDGYRVAPFKSQNMSSNYYVLADGSIMARSQAIAAYACNQEPKTDMNPILLMPESGKTQVILNGKSLGNLNSIEFSQMKAHALEEALVAYRRLAANNDIIVIEGAGSPVELNLNKNDIVNMGLAEKIGCPVILVSDINRGGVFASLYGTMMLLNESQRSMVKGVVVNKFIGEISYFQDGMNIIEQLCQVPLLGVLPYIDIKLEDEDSLADNNVRLKDRELISGLQYTGDTAAYRTLLGEEFSRLSEHFRTHLNMELIYKIMEEGEYEK